jgi:hypothetical protein
MASDLEKRVQERAYEIWESEGRPEGRHHEHWQQARAEFSEAQSEATAQKGRGRKEKAPGSSLTAKKPKTATKPRSATTSRASER